MHWTKLKLKILILRIKVQRQLSSNYSYMLVYFLNIFINYIYGSDINRKQVIEMPRDLFLLKFLIQGSLSLSIIIY